MKRLLVLVAARRARLRVAAQAHPLGNFTINHYAGSRPSGDRLYVLYVLDMAEIPTFQAKPQRRARGRVRAHSRLALHVTVDGRRRALVPVSTSSPSRRARRPAHDAARGAPRAAPGAPAARSTTTDSNYAGRIGWKEIVVGGARARRLVDRSARAACLPEEPAPEPARRHLGGARSRRPATGRRRPSPAGQRSSAPRGVADAGFAS